MLCTIVVILFWVSFIIFVVNGGGEETYVFHYWISSTVLIVETKVVLTNNVCIAFFKSAYLKLGSEKYIRNLKPLLKVHTLWLCLLGTTFPSCWFNGFPVPVIESCLTFAAPPSSPHYTVTFELWRCFWCSSHR